MNQKKAKRLRQELIKNGIDPTQKEYHAINVTPFNLVGTIRLNGACGRYKYQQGKEVTK